MQGCGMGLVGPLAPLKFKIIIIISNTQCYITIRIKEKLLDIILDTF